MSGKVFVEPPDHLLAEYRAAQKESSTSDRRQTLIGWLTLVAVVVYAIITGFIYCANRDAAKAALSAANTAKDTLIASNRPWINIETSPDGPFSFTASGANFPIKFKLLNVGHSPAMKAWANPELVLQLYSTEEVENERTKVCGEARKQSDTMGQTIFPGGEFNVKFGSAVNTTQLREATKFTSLLSAKIIVCVTYQSTVENSLIWHQTGIIYDVDRVDDKGLTNTMINGQESPAERMRLTYSFYRGVEAN